jgi:hypothetical protein
VTLAANLATEVAAVVPNITALVARQRAVRAIDASLLSKLTLLLA